MSIPPFFTILRCGSRRQYFVALFLGDPFADGFTDTFFAPEAADIVVLHFFEVGAVHLSFSGSGFRSFQCFDCRFECFNAGFESGNGC